MLAGAKRYTAPFGLRVALKFETRKNHSNVQYDNDNAADCQLPIANATNDNADANADAAEDPVEIFDMGLTNNNSTISQLEFISCQFNDPDTGTTMSILKKYGVVARRTTQWMDGHSYFCW